MMLPLRSLGFPVLSQGGFKSQLPAAECLLSVETVLSGIFSGCRVDVEGLEVLLADTFILKLWAASSSLAR